LHGYWKSSLEKKRRLKREAVLSAFGGMKDPNVDGKGCGDTALSPTQLKPGLSWSVPAENSMHLLLQRGGGQGCTWGLCHPPVTVPPPSHAEVTTARSRIKAASTLVLQPAC